MSRIPASLCRRALVLLAASMGVACAPSGSDGREESKSTTIFAAASLIDVFTEIGSAFEAENPGLSVDFNFASSSDLAAQILEGAPADVFAPADFENFESVRRSDVAIGRAQTFATNTLEIIVEAGNPLGITRLEDLQTPGLVFITCDESVPIGRYTAELLSRAGISIRPTSFEENVKGIVNKVVLGEADAGIVYRTDVLAAGSAARGVEIPPELNLTTRYPVAAIGSSPSESTREFVEFLLLSPTARAILEAHGFGLP